MRRVLWMVGASVVDVPIIGGSTPRRRDIGAGSAPTISTPPLGPGT
jgi:hypothetical protein